MVRIRKSKKAPKVYFVKKGHPHYRKQKCNVAFKQICSEFDSTPQPFHDGRYKFSADFGGKEFRKQLLICQGPKCCYCEKPVASGEIEHYRPKAAWQQTRKSKISRPGYYWLAYSWNNFLISCGECNSGSRKGYLFPVSGTRAVTRQSRLEQEKPVLINPAVEDPSKFVSYQKAMPIAVDKVGRGRDNINIFDLERRADLVTAREEVLELYITRLKIAKLKVTITKQPGCTLSKKNIVEARKFVVERINKKKPFAGMLIANLRNGTFKKLDNF